MGIFFAEWLGFLAIPAFVLAVIVVQVRRSRGQMFVEPGSAPTLDQHIRRLHRQRGW